MNGPQHYLAAEELLDNAAAQTNRPEAILFAALGIGHALLAGVAQRVESRSGVRERFDDWYEAVGFDPQDRL